MKMALATPFIESYGGMERVVLKIAKLFDADIYCYKYSPEDTFPDFEKLNVIAPKPGIIGKLPPRRMTMAIAAGKYFHSLKLDGYDIINAHQTPSEWIANRNRNVVWYCHTPNREAFDLYDWRMNRRNIVSKGMFWASIQAYKYFEFSTLPKVQKILTNSRNSQDRIKRYLKRDSTIIHPGVEIEKFKCKSHERFFFYPSRLVPEKDIEFAIEAFRGAKLQGWKLIVAGSSKNENYLKRLKSLCDGSIEIETNISEKRMLDLYARCYAVIYTPINEDFGLVPLEGMAAGKMCIAKDEGGMKETIIQGVDGFRCRDVQEMSRVIREAVAHPDLCRNMGLKGYEKVKASFTWDRFLKEFRFNIDLIATDKER